MSITNMKYLLGNFCAQDCTRWKGWEKNNLYPRRNDNSLPKKDVRKGHVQRNMVKYPQKKKYFFQFAAVSPSKSYLPEVSGRSILVACLIPVHPSARLTCPASPSWSDSLHGSSQQYSGHENKTLHKISFDEGQKQGSEQGSHCNWKSIDKTIDHFNHRQLIASTQHESPSHCLKAGTEEDENRSLLQRTSSSFVPPCYIPWNHWTFF